MPLIDVTSVLIDPDFAQRINVTRRAQIIDVNGRTVITPTALTPIGVVEPEVPPDFALEADMARDQTDIFVAAFKFKFLGPTDLGGGTTTQPDLITWQGTTYMVKKVLDWTQYGAGWSAAICQIEVPIGGG